jgi:hypothetical protein
LNGDDFSELMLRKCVLQLLECFTCMRRPKPTECPDSFTRARPCLGELPRWRMLEFNNQRAQVQTAAPAGREIHGANRNLRCEPECVCSGGTV